MNLSDGEHSLLDIANLSHCSFDMIAEAADLLRGQEILAPAGQ
jgi:aminopeptidase-like protein